MYFSFTTSKNKDYVRYQRVSLLASVRPSVRYRFIQFVKIQGETRQLVDIPPIIMDRYVGHFIMDLKQKNNTPYEPDTITGFHR